MEKIDLVKMRKGIESVAETIFLSIVSLPEEVRGVDKERTGIQVLVREPGTRNLVYVSVGEPSEAAKFFSVEKAVRSYVKGDYSSANGADFDKMEFPGSLTIDFHGMKLQGSISGMRADEDVTAVTHVLSYITQASPVDICRYVMKKGGVMPDAVRDEDHYLHKFITYSCAVKC